MHRHMILNPNPLRLVFTAPDFVENFVLNEIEKDYRLNDLGLTPNDLVVDIGAHTGVVSMYIAKKYGCKVTAVEPSPRNFDLLKKNIAANGLEHLITPLNFAVTRDGRDVQIGDNPINWGGNNIYQGGVPAKSIRLADIIQSPVALLKMDCERAEFEILEDLTPLKWVKAIRGEFHGHEEGDIEALLARVQVVVRDARPTMHHSWALRNKQRQQKRK